MHDNNTSHLTRDSVMKLIKSRKTRTYRDEDDDDKSNTMVLRSSGR